MLNRARYLKLLSGFTTVLVVLSTSWSWAQSRPGTPAPPAANTAGDDDSPGTTAPGQPNRSNMDRGTFTPAPKVKNPIADKGPVLECRFLPALERLFLQQHVSRANRDSLRDRVVDQYIKSLDPMKMYLLAADVEKISSDLKQVFVDVPKENCVELLAIQKMVKERVGERARFAKNFLGPKYKYDASVEFVLDPQKQSFRKTQAELESFLQKYVHFQISNYLATDMKLDEAKENVRKSWDRQVRRLNEVKQEDVMSAYLNAFANALDPHSSFFPKESNEDFQIQMSLSLQGIGATLSSQDGFTVIESLVPGGPAARSGLLQPQDKILAVGQGTQAMENVIEMDLRDVVRKIRGPKGTPVRLMVMRKEGDGRVRKEISLIRDQVKLEDSAAQLHIKEQEIDGRKAKLGVIELPSFYSDGKRMGGRSSAADVDRLLREARDKKVEGLVFDVSRNGGGSLEDAVRIVGLFIARGAVVKQSVSGGREMILEDPSGSLEWSGPIVVLTSRISASASEILAGSLKDYRRAVVVGSDHTFGKGTIQTVIDIPPQSGELGAVKVTVGMFYTPGGFSTQHRGVTADVIFPGSFDSDEVGEKSLDYSLPPAKVDPFLGKAANPRNAWKPITEDWLKTLRQRSGTRVAASEEFKKISDELAKSEKQGKLIRLADATKNKEKRDKDAAIRAASKEEKEKEYLKRADVQEAFSILVDLVQLEAGKTLKLTEASPAVGKDSAPKKL